MSIKHVCVVASVVVGTVVSQAADLPRATPESQGVESPRIQAFIESIDKNFDSMNSFMLVRHGHVVAEGWWAPYRADVPHALFSLSKSFTSTAVGLAVAEGKLSVDDLVLKHFSDEAPSEPSDNLKKMRISDLLRMATGHETEPPRTDDISWAKQFLTHPVKFRPGTHFFYNTPGTYMQSAIVQKVTGVTILEYLKPRLFEPLGIENANWEESPQEICTGGFGLSIRTEDIAKFGQLYLQRGMWQGKRLIPEPWIDAATSRQTSNGSNPVSDWEQGYGYQFWRCRHGAYRGDGAFGQYCVVLPDQDAVIAMTSGLRDTITGQKDMQRVLDQVWETLLPAMKSSSLPDDDAARLRLEQTLKNLSLRPQEGDAAPANDFARKYVFPPNESKLESVRLEAANDRGEQAFTMRFDGTEYRFAGGRGQWAKGTTRWGLWKQRGWGPVRDEKIAVSAAWTAANTFAAKICYYEKPFVISVTLKFFDDEVQFHAVPNLAFDPKSDIQGFGIAGDTVHATLKVAAADAGTADTTTSATIKKDEPLRATKAHDFNKWEKEIAAFEAADRLKPPAKGGVVFVGASIVKLWKTLAEDFPNHNVINRGFGGSEIVDSTHFADRLVFPHEPKQVYLRAGGNDINAGRLPEEVAADFEAFVNKVHARLPKAEIYFIAISPSPARWGQRDKTQKLNELIRNAALKMPRVGFVDDSDMTVDAHGQPRKELFVADMLHLNSDGYALLANRVRPYLPMK